MASGRHILVIEDDYDLLFLIKKLLEMKGFKVITAITGKEGKKKFRKHSRELFSVILDLSLPDLDGKKICGEFRKKQPDLPIIITTGSEDQKQKQELDNIGIQAFLKKPFDLHELVDCISSFN
ncbi:MAG: response regulator transcription factor [Calditrichaeota bacterium]|nr:response regulator transcription factor [Calditrichota bacterium]